MRTHTRTLALVVAVVAALSLADRCAADNQITKRKQEFPAASSEILPSSVLKKYDEQVGRNEYGPHSVKLTKWVKGSDVVFMVSYGFSSYRQYFHYDRNGKFMESFEESDEGITRTGRIRVNLEGYLMKTIKFENVPER